MTFFARQNSFLHLANLCELTNDFPSCDDDERVLPDNGILPQKLRALAHSSFSSNAEHTRPQRPVVK